MLKKSCLNFVVAASVVSLLVLMQPALAGLTNGSFSDDFTGNSDPNLNWSVELGTVQHWVISGDGTAIFIQDEENYDPSSTLSQIFTLDPGSLTLSFEMEMETNGGETDVFMASLLDTLGNPLVSVSGGTYFYSLDSSANEETAAGVSVIGNTVTLDVSSLAGEDEEVKVNLVFDLFHDYDDTVDTNVLLDNVAVSLIPAPGALMLSTVGVGFVTWLRRRRTL